jgi:acetoin utilization protein AcuB
MITAEELINPMIPPLKPIDKASKAIIWMEELRVNQLPVIDQGRFLGLISEELVLEENEIDKTIGEFHLLGENCYVFENQHITEVIKVSYDCDLQVIAVLSPDGVFKGVITAENTMLAMAQTLAVQNEGAILTMSMRQIDYSMAEISRLVEENSAKILGVFITPDNLDPSKIKVTLKLNKSDLSHILATLERFGYQIVATFQESKFVSNDKERLDLLFKYLSF